MRRFLFCLAAGLFFIPTPAAAVEEAALREWLQLAAPMVLANDPVRYADQMESKKLYFTPEGFEGFKNAIETSGTDKRAMRVAGLCVTGARLAEGGMWIADTAIIYKKQEEPTPEPVTEPGGPPRSKVAYFYHKGQFYIKDSDTQSGLKIHQYIAELGPKEGFDTCRARGEMEEKMGAIDEQLAFYQNTLATLQQKIAELNREKQILLGIIPPEAPAAPVALEPQAAPPSPAQPMPEEDQPASPPTPQSAAPLPEAEQVLDAPAAPAPPAPAPALPESPPVEQPAPASETSMPTPMPGSFARPNPIYQESR